ncbi:MAG: ABC transporter substrate-binding protein [Euzebya sp.]
MAADPQPKTLLDQLINRREVLKRLGWAGAVWTVPPALLAACTPTSDPVAEGSDAATPAATGGTASATSTATGSASPAAGTPRAGGDFVMAVNIDVPQLDPHNQQSLAMLQTYEAPLRRTLEYGEQVPNLAESVDVSDDGLEYILHLRSDVTFHDGSPFDAEAYVFALSRTAYEDDPNHQGGPFQFWDAFAGGFPGKVTAIEAMDPMTVRLALSEPIIDFMFVLADSFPMAAVNPAAIEADPANFGQSPETAGTGPFKFSERVAGDRVTLTRHDGYWQEDRPYLDSWTLRVMPDPGARVLALQTGEIHLFDVSGPEIAQLQDNPDIQLLTVPPIFGNFLGFDHNDELVGQKEVRQAISQALDLSAIVGELSPFAQVTPNFGLFPGFPGFRDDLAWYPYDPDAARQLLSDAGYPDGIDITMSFSTPPIGLNTLLLSQALQGQLAEAGIRTELQQIDPPTFFQSSFGPPGRTEYPYQVAINLVGSDGNAFSMMQQWTYSANYAGYNPGYLELYGQAAQEIDDEAREAIYGELQQMLYDDVAFVPLAHTEVVRAAAANARGLETAAYYFTDVWFDEA